MEQGRFIAFVVITDQFKFAMNCRIHSAQVLQVYNIHGCSMHRRQLLKFLWHFLRVCLAYIIQYIQKSSRVCYQCYDILLLLLMLLSPFLFAIFPFLFHGLRAILHGMLMEKHIHMWQKSTAEKGIIAFVFVVCYF